MRYAILLLTEAQEDLDRLRAFERAMALDAIETHLRHLPRLESRSRIKRLRGRDGEYRLRIGAALRAFYRVEGNEVLVLRVMAKDETAEYYGGES